MTNPDNITDLLAKMHAGKEDVINDLLPKVRAELRRIANVYFSKERAAHNFDPSDLVQDMSLRLLIPGKGPFKNREHFFAIAARNVRQKLADYGRVRCAQRR